MNTNLFFRTGCRLRSQNGYCAVGLALTVATRHIDNKIADRADTECHQEARDKRGQHSGSIGSNP